MCRRIPILVQAVDRCRSFCFNRDLIRRIGLQLTCFPKARKYITSHEFNTIPPEFCRSRTMILTEFNATFDCKITWNHLWIRNKLSRPLQLLNIHIVIQFLESSVFDIFPYKIREKCRSYKINTVMSVLRLKYCN